MHGRGGWCGEPLAGRCAFVVQDAGGHSDTLVTAPFPPVAERMPQLVYPPHEGFSYETILTLRWTEVVAGATYTVDIWSHGFTYDPDVTRVWLGAAGSGTSVQYNADGTAAEPELLAGHRYEWQVEAHACDDAGVTDPRVYVYTAQRVWGAFQVYSAAPVVDTLWVDTMADRHYPGWLTGLKRVWLHVTHGEGCDRIAAVEVVDPDSGTMLVTPENAFEWQTIGGETILEVGYELNLPAITPTTGAYVLTPIDRDGQRTTWVTQPIAWPLFEPTAPAQDSTITDTEPTFRWVTYGREENRGEMRLFREGDTPGCVPEAYLPIEGNELPCMEWSFRCWYPQDELLPGRMYVWWARAEWDRKPVSPHVWVSARASALARFTVRGSWPDRPWLPGKLAYSTYLGNVSMGAWGLPVGIRLYTTDPNTPTWLGPADADSPDWSPDGRRLAYVHLYQLWINPLDGRPPAPIPGLFGADPRWSPDGEWLVLARQVIEPGRSTDLWITDLTGAQARLLRGDLQIEEPYPAWSPDGQWIAYRRSPDDMGRFLWLVRPDGADAHPVTATGVAGYPGYTVGYMGEHAWSPTGQHLVTAFDAEGPAGEDLRGIGTIPVGGGEIRPVYIAPPGYVRCAAPHLPYWSPDGTKIVFASAHHLPPNPDWAVGRTEPGSELWMVPADGPGEPVRLTYDCSFNHTVSWWEERVFLDVTMTHWAGGAIRACRDAGVVAGLPDGTYQPTLAVTREQMAVYVSRALLGGGTIPTGPPTPSFGDMSPDHWAYRCGEYLKQEGVVSGYTPDTYAPGLTCTRDQMAVYVARGFGLPM